jgi:hypothetical protein
MAEPRTRRTDYSSQIAMREPSKQRQIPKKHTDLCDPLSKMFDNRSIETRIE